MKYSRILVCGGRDFDDQKLFNSKMEEASKWFSDRYVIIQGGARGADRMAAVWAFFKGVPMISMPANWDFYSKGAGPIRNSWMIEFAMPDLVIAFPGGTGTANMIQQAEDANIQVWEI